MAPSMSLAHHLPKLCSPNDRTPSSLSLCNSLSLSFSLRLTWGVELAFRLRDRIAALFDLNGFATIYDSRSEEWVL